MCSKPFTFEIWRTLRNEPKWNNAKPNQNVDEGLKIHPIVNVFRLQLRFRDLHHFPSLYFHLLYPSTSLFNKLSLSREKWTVSSSLLRGNILLALKDMSKRSRGKKDIFPTAIIRSPYWNYYQNTLEYFTDRKLYTMTYTADSKIAVGKWMYEK